MGEYPPPSLGLQSTASAPAHADDLASVALGKQEPVQVLEPSKAEEKSVTRRGAAAEQEGNMDGNCKEEERGEEVEEDFLELVEYLKRVNLDQYSERLRAEFGIDRVEALACLHGAATDRVQLFKLTKLGIRASDQRKIMREAVRIREGFKKTPQPPTKPSQHQITAALPASSQAVQVIRLPQQPAAATKPVPTPASSDATVTAAVAASATKSTAIAMPSKQAHSYSSKAQLSRSQVSPVSSAGSPPTARDNNVTTPPGAGPFPTPRSPPLCNYRHEPSALFSSSGQAGGKHEVRGSAVPARASSSGATGAGFVRESYGAGFAGAARCVCVCVRACVCMLVRVHL